MKTLKTWLQTRALNSAHADVRLRVVQDAANSRDASATTALIHSLTDSNDEVREAAAAGLGKTGSREGIKPLVALLLNEKVHDVLAASADALQQLDGRKAAKLFLAALNDNDTAVCQNAAWALRSTGWTFLDDADRARVLIIQNEWDKAAALGSAAIAPLQAVLLDGTDHLKRLAAGALGHIGTPKAFRALTSLLTNPKVNSATCERAAWALKKFYRDNLTSVQAAFVAIIERDWEEAVRLDNHAVEPLRIALDDDDNDVRMKVIQTLTRIGGTKAVDSIVHALSDARQPVSVRELAATSLGELGDQRALNALGAALGSEGWTVREAAARSLAETDWRPADDAQRAQLAIIQKKWSDVGALGQAAIGPLIESLKYLSVATDAAKALVNIGSSGVDALLGMLRDHNQPSVIRELIAASLAEAGEPRAVEVVVGMLVDPDMATRQSAVWTLERLGWQPVDDKQRAAFAVAHDDWDELANLGAAAVEPLLTLAAGSMAPNETVTVLCQILGSSAACLSIKQLRSLVSLPDIDPQSLAGLGFRGASMASPSAAVACDKVRKLARFELIHRGIMF